MKLLTTLTLGALLSSQQLFAGEYLHFKVQGIDTSSAQATARMLPLSEQTRRTNFFVVQFKQPVQEQQRKLLIENGIKILKYIPEDALIVKVEDLHTLTRLKGNSLVQATIPFASFLKISPEFGPLSIFNRDLRARILVQAFSNEDADRVAGLLEAQQVVRHSGKVVIFDGTMQQVGKLADLDGVEWIQPAPEFKTMAYDLLPDNEVPEPNETMLGDYSDLSGFESGTKVMKFDLAHSRGFEGEGQIVAMADTGLDSGDTSTLKKDVGHLVEGQVYGLFSRSWGDPNGHGTHVTGSVVGNGSLSQGKIMGGAPKAGYIAQGMWSPLLNNLTVPPQLDKLFSKAFRAGARVHTNSWGSPVNLGSYDANAQQVDEFTWENPELLILFAAGNSGQDEDKDGRVDEGSVSSPGTSKNALTVGASENLLDKGGIQRKLSELRSGDQKWGVEPLKSDTLSNNPNGIAAFSSRGPTRDGRLKPDIVAPGTNILSLCSSYEGAGELWGRYNENYCFSGGTSMATPLVAGAAAVTREFLQSQGVARPMGSLVKAVLMHTADDLYPGQYGFREQGQEMLKPGPNNHQGYGRVNLQNVTQKQGYYLYLGTEKVSSDSSFEKSFTVENVKELKVTMVYTDAPGSASAAKALVNNLDLEVMYNGETHALQDTLNNHEQIVLKDVSGKVTVRVKAISLPQPRNGFQSFSLVASQIH